jgi:hypothetical protein
MQQVVRSTDVRAYITVNLKFHRCIYRSAGAPTLLSMIETIWAKFAGYSRWANTNLALGTLNNHARALEGIMRCDAIMTRTAIIQDCCDSCEIQLRLLAERELGEMENGLGKWPDTAQQRPVSGSLGSLVGSRRRGRPAQAGGVIEQRWRRSVPLEILDFALVLLGGRPRTERPQVSPLAGFGIGLARVKPILAALEFPDHDLRSDN